MVKVLKLCSREERDRFAHRLTQYLEAGGMSATRRFLVEGYILRSAVTRKVRQERLEKFFKKILSVCACTLFIELLMNLNVWCTNTYRHNCFSISRYKENVSWCLVRSLAKN